MHAVSFDNLIIIKSVKKKSEKLIKCLLFSVRHLASVLSINLYLNHLLKNIDFHISQYLIVEAIISTLTLLFKL